MKINYTFANGEVSEVEVNEEIGNVILDSRRLEDNLARKERYHCYSMDAADYEGEEYADQETPEAALFLQLENKSIADAFACLLCTGRKPQHFGKHQVVCQEGL